MSNYPKSAVYNKLVRDRIPAIIESDSLKAETRELTDSEVVKELMKKIIEESTELSEAEGTEEISKEMSDVLEVLISLAERLDLSMEEIERLRLMRAEKRGRFEKGIFLVRTYEEDK